MTLTQRKMEQTQPLLDENTSASKDKPVQEKDTSVFKLVTCFLGIFISYLLFGICLEKITRGKYGENGDEKFKFPQVLVFLQCIINGLFAKGMTIYKRGSARDFVRDRTPVWLYACCGASYMFAMLSSTNALKYVNYPTQVIGKACKPIAVMILGIILAGKRYGLQKIICVCIIVIGVILFMYNPDKAGSDSNGFNLGWGELFLLGSLFLDGFTGVFQEKMRSDPYKTTEHNMMYNMNFYGCLILSAMILFTGEIWEFLDFAMKFPVVWSMIGLYGACSAIGQHFIFVTVVTFGPLMCSVITTTRKFFTVLCSVFLFNNPMTMQKWAATGLVFFGLGLDVYGKKKKK